MTMETHDTGADARIQADVMRELAADTRVRATDIGVAVEAGVVTLTGAVDYWARRHAAQQAAHRVQGVRDVANDIEVRVPGSLRRTDAEIARAVRRALEWDARVPDDRIRCTVSDGDVTLEGSVEYWSQREDAEDSVRNLAGVSSVNNALEVDPPGFTEEDVRRAITDALQRRVRRQGEGIEIILEGGRVTLAGVVETWAERAAVTRAVGALPGVRGVTDRLRLAR